MICTIPETDYLLDGVRNYQARNFMRDMAVGDQVLFYHSNAEPPASWGLQRSCGLPIRTKRSLTRPATTTNQPVLLCSTVGHGRYPVSPDIQEESVTRPVEARPEVKTSVYE